MSAGMRHHAQSGDQVQFPRNVIESQKTIGKEEHRIRLRGSVGRNAATLILQFISEVADESSREIEWQAGVFAAMSLGFVRQKLEDALRKHTLTAMA